MSGRVAKAWASLVVVFLGAQSTSALSLNCDEVQKLTAFYNKAHFSVNVFDDEISRRTLKNYIQAWDPGKVIFLKADVDDLKTKYEVKLDDMIQAKDCSAIEAISALYSRRFSERHKLLGAMIDKPHDFTKDEYLTIDRKKMDYPATTEEADDRWNKRVKYQLLQLKSSLSDLGKAREKLHKRYQLEEKRHQELTSDDAYAFFLSSFSTALDPHSSYFPADAREEFNIQTRLSLEGIGAELRSEDGITTVARVVPGGAAAKAGTLFVNDKIIEVAEGAKEAKDVVDMDLREVVKLIRGNRGSEVRLSVLRDEGGQSKKLVIAIIREKIELEDHAAKSRMFDLKIVGADKKEERTLKVGLIDLPAFYLDFSCRHSKKAKCRSSSADVSALLEKLNAAKIDALVLDLRSNAGGALDEAVAVTGLFIDQGPVVQIKAAEEKPDVLPDNNAGVIYAGPLVVLTTRQSASASEIVAGALQDYGRALTIGDKSTFGKGTVQNVQDISEKLGAVKVTVKKFYRPSGSSTQLRGVESDVVLPSILEVSELGEAYYDYALPWDNIEANPFKASGEYAPFVEPLRKVSSERLSASADFKEIYEAIEKVRAESQEGDKISLKEEVKKDEKANCVAVTDIDKKRNANPARKGKGRPDAKVTPDHKKIAAKGSDEPTLDTDVYLQEALRITSDYVQLTHKRKPGQTILPISKVTPAKNDTKCVDANAGKGPKSPLKEKEDPSRDKTKPKEIREIPPETKSPSPVPHR